MTIVHLDMGLTSLISALISTFAVLIAANRNRTTPDGCNLTTTEQTVTDITAPHLHIGKVNTTVVDISTTKDITTTLQPVQTYMVGPGLIVQFLLIVLVNISRGVVSSCRIIDIANITVVEGNMSCTEHGTTLTTGIGITLNGRNSLIETITIDTGCLFFLDTNYDIGFTINITGLTCIYGSFMMTYRTFPSAAIDITDRTAFDIGICFGHESLLSEFILHATTGTAGIEVFLHRTTMQPDIGLTADHCRSTQSATITIAHDSSPFIDIDVGIGLLVKRIHMGIERLQIVIGISAVQCFINGLASGILVKALLRFYIQHHTGITTAIDFIDLSTIIQINPCITRPTACTIAGTIYRCRIAR